MDRGLRRAAELEGLTPWEVGRQDLTAWDPVPERPPDRTCLACHVHAVLLRDGCVQDHRATRQWAERRGRDPDALVAWASSLGGCCCDCEVVTRALRTRSALRRAGVVCGPAFAALQGRDARLWGDDELLWGEDELDDRMPAVCPGT